MASTSNQTGSSSYVPNSSTNTPRWIVFLSFSGEDTRRNFTGHLYKALDRAGIQTFMDDPELPKGEEISSGLLEAIQASKISIVVFSKNYASSPWCLDELVKIIECRKIMGQLVLPIFYNVNPSDVRRQNGSFAEAFEKHKIRFVADMDKVEKWRDTLIEAGKLSGYRIDENVCEADLIEKIVDNILLQLNSIALDVAKYPVGIHSRVKDITPLLRFGINDVKKRVRRIGIYGMGGVGKTTIAKAVYNENFLSFQGSCFLANVREVSGQPNGLVRLQEQFISEVLKNKKFTIDSVDKGISLIKERLCLRKVLIVLDDLSLLSQLDSLAGPWNLFSQGSVIIITTRDECLLDQIQVEDRYMVNELDNDESLELFSRHAFGKTKPLNDFMTISKDIVKYARGLPLALEVFGSTLYEQTMIGWRSFIVKLRQMPNKKIQEKLIISYDSLDDANLKDIFLDIACFFVGMNKSEAVTVLETCYKFVDNEINILIKKCLLTINDNNELRMHDLVRDMGREIVRHKFPKEPEKWNRLWSCRDTCNVLQKYKGTEAIEGIVLDESDKFEEDLKKVPLNAKTFISMHRLRLLDIKGLHLTGSFKDIFQELRWLCWLYCPLECLPSDFHPEKLVILQMSYSKIKTLWHGTLFLEQLKTLNLKSCEYLTTTPDFTGVPCLENLILSYCTSLVEVHPSIGSLGRLVYLDFSYCESLSILPSNICNLRALERLYLHSCENLGGLPENLGNMECLRELRAGYYTRVNKMPDSIGYMKKLEILTMSSLGRTDNAFVPPSISGLCSLRVLNLNFCNLFDGDLPDTIGSLSSLEHLKLSKNNFSTLPFNLSRLFNLKSLHLSGCQSLRSLPELPHNLEYLNASDCISMEKLPNLSNLNRLEELYLPNCIRLAEIQGLEKLNSISFIDIIGCNNVVNTFEESFFQVYSGFGKEIEIFLPIMEIPDWFSHQNTGSSICFDVPPDERNNLIRIILWVVVCGPSEAVVEIGTRSTWIHSLWSWSFEKHSAVSFIPSISSGVSIEVSVKGNYSNVERCGVHLVYEPDTTVIDMDVNTQPQA